MLEILHRLQIKMPLSLSPHNSEKTGLPLKRSSVCCAATGNSRKRCVKEGKVLLGYFADSPPQKLAIISILAAFLRMNSSKVKQFNSAVPEAEIMCVMNTGDSQTASPGSPLGNLRSTH